jgi:structural maintenance of chromosome 1
MDLALEYNKAKEEQDRAAEAANANNAKKRSMITERKHFEVQTAEIRQWQALCDEKVGYNGTDRNSPTQDETTQRWLLWKLYHIFQGIDTSSELLDQAAEDVDQLREAIVSLSWNLEANPLQIDRAAELKQARRDHAEMQLAVSKRETRAKEADKAAEEARARLVAVQTQITHSERKATSSSSLLKRVRVDRERQAGVLADLEKGAAAIRESMEAARERQRKKSVAKGAALSEEDLAEYRQL